MSPAPLTAQIAQLKRQHILNAAIELIAEQGYQHTTIKQIAARAGMADGTIYNHFANKDALLFAILEQLSEAEIREVHFAEAESLLPEVFLSEYVTHRMQEIDESFAVYKAIAPEIFTNSALAQAAYDNIYAPGFAIAEQYFQRLMDTGKMPGGMPSGDPAIAARLFASPIMGILLLRLMGDRHVIENWAAYTQPLIQFMQTRQP
ncbi:MAG: hypothetical protein Fur0022_48380 [Anaerolineales bacterium]